MPTFAIQQPKGIADSIRLMLTSSPNPSAEQYAKADNLIASNQAHTALAEKYRAEVEAIRQKQAAEAADRAFRENPDNALDYASTVSGVPRADVAQWDRARRGEMTGGVPAIDAQGRPLADQSIAMPPVPVRAPDLAPQVVDQIRAALGSLGANRFATGKTNADQMTQAGGNLLKQAITAAATNPNLTAEQRVANSEAITGKVVEPYKEGASGGSTINTMTGATADTPTEAGRLARALVGAKAGTERAHQDAYGAQAGLHRARTGEITAGGGRGKSPAGYVWGPPNAQGQPTLIAVQGGPANPTGGASGGTDSLSGDALLATLPGPIATQVKALAEGKMQFPAGFALKSPYWQDMISKVAQYDPSFDAVNYNARAKTRNGFVAGKEGQMLNALNTVMGHLDELEKAGTALNNTDYPFINKAVNTIGSAVNPDLKGRLNTFNLTRQAVASEMERAYRGTGGDLESLKAWKSTLDTADSPEAIRAAIKGGVKLLSSKIEALGDQYNKGMGTTKRGLELLNPSAQKTFKRFLGESDSTAQSGASKTYTQADLEHTAKAHGLTVEQVKAKLGIK